MSHQQQFEAFLAAVGITPEHNPGGTGDTLTVRDTVNGTGYSEWRFDYAGNFEWVKHYAA